MTLEDLLTSAQYTLPETRRFCRLAGYTHVKVSTGQWLTLAEWRPYSGIPEHRLTFVVNTDEDAIIDRPADNGRLTRMGFALGCWPLKREPTS